MVHRKKIALVDDSLTNLEFGRQTLAGEYDVYTAESGEKLFELLTKTIPDMILLDIEMPRMNGYEVIQFLKGNSKTAKIPVIFLTSRSDTESELKGLSLGAIDYIFKPFSPVLLCKRVEGHLLIEEQKLQLQQYSNNLEEMVRLKTDALLELQYAIVETVADIVESRDNATGGHIHRTQRYFQILLDAMRQSGLYKSEMLEWDDEQLVLSAQLHDVGKISVSDAILRKPGKLTPEEFEEMKTHTTSGAAIIDKIQARTGGQVYLEYARTLALSHHEHWNGRGYPYGLKGTEIPLAGRIMAIVDVYDALISLRPYKESISHNEAVRIMMDGKGQQFDPDLCDLFLTVANKFAEIAFG